MRCTVSRHAMFTMFLSILLVTAGVICLVLRSERRWLDTAWQALESKSDTVTR
jgi:hypothetical protein